MKLDLKAKPFYLTDEDIKWVEETLEGLTLDEKIGQIFVDMLWNNTEEEVKEKFNWIYLYKNIIIKYGRYRPNQKPHYDEVLGVNLISDNQYAKAYNMGIAT